MIAALNNGAGASVRSETYLRNGSFAPYNGARRGAAYVFTRISSRWAQQQKLIANDGEADDSFGIAVALDGDTLLVGALSGVLPAPGTYNFTITATDLSSYCSSSRPYTITVVGPCSPIAISPSSLPYGFTFEPYSETLTAIGGVGPYTFNMQGMPPIMGLSLSADGVLSGTPKKQPPSTSQRRRATYTDASGRGSTTSQSTRWIS